MKFRKIITTLATVSLGFVVLSGCSDNKPVDGGGAAGDEKPLIAVVAKGSSSPFWAAVKKGAEDAGAALGADVDFNGPDNEQATDQQNSQLDQALSRQPKALVFAALDSKASVTKLEQFQSEDIPVIAFDSGVADSDIPETTVATNNREAAAKAAEELATLLNKTGEVVIACHSQTSITGTDREGGFRDWLADNAPDIKVVDVQYNDSDQSKADQQIGAMVAANPNLSAIFATDDDGAVAAAQTVERLDKQDQIKIVGFDSGKVQMDFIRSGTISGAITQNPYQMGYKAVEIAYNLVVKNKQPESKATDSGFAWYTKDNIDTPEIQEAVYD